MHATHRAKFDRPCRQCTGFVHRVGERYRGAAYLCTPCTEKRDTARLAAKIARTERKSTRRDMPCTQCGAVTPNSGHQRKFCKPCANCRNKAAITPEMAAAAYKVQKALRAGTMIRPDYCQRCASRCKPHGHHFNGYKGANALRVIWLCVYCHRHVHFLQGLSSWQKESPARIRKRHAEMREWNRRRRAPREAA